MVRQTVPVILNVKISIICNVIMGPVVVIILIIGMEIGVNQNETIRIHVTISLNVEILVP